MINHTNVERLAAIFTGFFVDLNFNENLKDVTFLEILLGFMYSYEKLVKSVELIDLLSKKQFKQIKEILEKTVIENVNDNSDLQKMLMEIKNQIKEEKDVEGQD